MKYIDKYEKWLNNENLLKELKDELIEIKDNEIEIQDRFHQDLKFGTAGLRGKLGAGTNRMNIYTVALASKGLADTIIAHGEKAKHMGVAIGYDVRYKSKEFAEVTASVLAAHGIKVYLHKNIVPTPVLSYTVRKLSTVAGVMITASHNPQEYNGYKAYWKEGSQILDDIADEILENISKVENYFNIEKLDFQEGLANGIIEYVDDKIIEDYKKEVLNLTINEDIDKDINIVYSPLNGTGNVLVREILDNRGFTNVHIVKEQELPDPDFTTVGYPNPEDPKAFEYAIKLGKEVGADLLLATDPDADRIAIEVRDKNGEYVFLNGNKIGSLMSYYIFSQLSQKGSLPEKPALVKSIVTGDLSKSIASKYGVETFDVLTGFKNIYAPANEWDKTKEYNYVFGYEESIGFGYGSFVRDKDAVSATMIIVEMAAYYKKQNKTLLDVLDDLDEEFGFYGEKLESIVLEGLDGQALIARIMEDYRNNPIQKISTSQLIKVIDYQNDNTGLPKSNVLKYYYDNKSWFAVRPSGTEPKIKLYIYSVGKSKEERDQIIEDIYILASKKIKNVK